EIGKLVSSTFEADRIRIKGIIDEQLRATTSSAMPLTLRFTETSTNLPLVDPNAQYGASYFDRSLRGDEPMVRVDRSGTNTSHSLLFTSASALPEAQSPLHFVRGPVVAIALSAVALGALGFWWFAPRSSPAPTTETAKPATSVATPPPPLQVEINIVA